MSGSTLPMTDDLEQYLRQTWLREHPVLRRLRAETNALGREADMEIAPEQGQLMALLLELIGARKVLEVGTFRGYSAAAMALALPPGGRLITCDSDPSYADAARGYWAEAGLADRIELRLGPGADTLRAMLAAGEAGTFDACFIDADKVGYETYYELCLELIRTGGLLMFDNVFRHGAVIDETDTRPPTVTMRRLNARMRDDERVSLAIIPIADGLTLARKR